MNSGAPIDHHLPEPILAVLYDQFKNWWNNLQPDWRRSPAVPVNMPLSFDAPPGETWSALAHGGRNGMALVLICVAWLTVQDVRPDGLEDLFHDVRWVFAALFQQHREGGIWDVQDVSKPRETPRPWPHKTVRSGVRPTFRPHN